MGRRSRDSQETVMGAGGIQPKKFHELAANENVVVEVAQDTMGAPIPASEGTEQSPDQRDDFRDNPAVAAPKSAVADSEAGDEKQEPEKSQPEEPKPDPAADRAKALAERIAKAEERMRRQQASRSQAAEAERRAAELEERYRQTQAILDSVRTNPLAGLQALGVTPDQLADHLLEGKPLAAAPKQDAVDHRLQEALSEIQALKQRELERENAREAERFRAQQNAAIADAVTADPSRFDSVRALIESGVWQTNLPTLVQQRQWEIYQRTSSLLQSSEVLDLIVREADERRDALLSRFGGKAGASTTEQTRSAGNSAGRQSGNRTMPNQLRAPVDFDAGSLPADSDARFAELLKRHMR